jgi:hypothetical protein
MSHKSGNNFPSLRYVLFLILFSHGVRLSPLGTAATVWSIICAPDDRLLLLLLTCFLYVCFVLFVVFVFLADSVIGLRLLSSAHK